MLLSIDPGLRACGCARWIDGALQQAIFLRGSKEESLPHAVAQMVNTVRAWSGGKRDFDLIIELPQTYRGRAERGDANDLIALGCIVGGIHDALSAAATIYVRPREWKGQLRKEITEARCRAALTLEELRRVKLPSAKSLQHNVWDGVGIGLWHLRKTGRRK